MLMVYVISSSAAALAGIILAGRLGSGSSNSGQGFELEVIAAVVLGGTSLFGGRGTIIGTVLGALLVVTIQNGLNLLNVPPAFQDISVGLLLVGALAIQAIRRKVPVEALDDKR